MIAGGKKGRLVNNDDLWLAQLKYEFLTHDRPVYTRARSPKSTPPAALPPRDIALTLVAWA